MLLSSRTYVWYNVSMTRKIKLTKRQIREAEAFDKLRKDPIQFMKVVFGREVVEHQIPIIRSCLSPETPLTTVATCHAVGKSTVGAMAAITMLLTHKDSIIIIAANNLKQARNGVFKECEKLLRICKLPITYNKNQSEIRINDSNAWKIMISASDPHSDSGAQGIHGDKMLVVIDEGAGIHDNIFAQLDSCLTSSGNKGVINNMLLLGNPTNSTGQFYRKYKSKASNSMNLSAFDTPNLKHFGITIQDYRNDTWRQKMKGEDPPYRFLISPSKVNDLFQEYGEDSHFFKTRVLAQFPVGNTVGMFTGKMIGEATTQADSCLRGNLRMGFDVSGTVGGDKSILSVIQDNGLLAFHKIDAITASEQIQEVYSIIQRYQAEGHIVEYCNIDADGMGIMTYNATKDNYPSELFYAFNGNGVSKLLDVDGNKQYGNIRSEGYATLASLLRKTEFYLPDRDPDTNQLLSTHDVLIDELYATDLDTTKQAISLVAKSKIKKKLKGKSPDHADALIMALVDLRDTSKMALREYWEALST